jgi:hypothetical protein
VTISISACGCCGNPVFRRSPVGHLDIDNQTFSSLGATPGTYEWTWGSGANQSFTFDIEAVPVPLIGRGLPVLLAVGGLLFGAKSLEGTKRHRLQFG